MKFDLQLRWSLNLREVLVTRLRQKLQICTTGLWDAHAALKSLGKSWGVHFTFGAPALWYPFGGEMSRHET